MGNTMQVQEEEPPLKLPSLTALPSQNPNPPDILVNEKIITSQITPKSSAEIIAEFLKISLSVPSNTSKNNYILPTSSQTSPGELNKKATNPQGKDKNNENITTAMTACSENDYIDGNNNNNNHLIPVETPDNMNDSHLLDDSTVFEEPIKTEAGSLMIDIRKIYKFKDVLGGGHFGTVRIGFRRNEPAPHRLYAIKSICKKHLSPKDLEELTKEVDIISSLDHPNIIKFYETYHDKFYFHIVMELCTGKDLFEKIRSCNGKIQERKVAVVIMKVLHAISYCHSRGITHRDLKPENILFESSEIDPEIKLIDFGLSRKYSSHEKMHTILGTPYYVAPEVLKGSYDEKCDIWSIGALTYIMLSGEPPFKGGCNNDIFHKILHNDLKFDTRKWANISPAAIEFVKSCLDKDPEKRPSASMALTSEWFDFVLTHVHSSILINKEILNTIKTYTPSCRFKKYVLKYFINMMSHSEIKQYKTIFYAVDFNHDGTIGKEELEQAFKLSGIRITPEEIRKIMTASDDVNKQSLDYSEFIIVCLDLKKFMSKEKVESAFNYFDIDNSGYIEALDIENALLRFGKKILHEDDIYKMIREVTKKPNKKDISFEEFRSIFPCCFDKTSNKSSQNDLRLNPSLCQIKA